MAPSGPAQTRADSQKTRQRFRYNLGLEISLLSMSTPARNLP